VSDHPVLAAEQTSAVNRNQGWHWNTYLSKVGWSTTWTGLQLHVSINSLNSMGSQCCLCRMRKWDRMSYRMWCIALASIPTMHLLQDRILGVAVLVWLGALLLNKLCRPLSSCAGRRTLWSSVHSNLVIPFTCSAAMQTRFFLWLV